LPATLVLWNRLAAMNRHIAQVSLASLISLSFAACDTPAEPTKDTKPTASGASTAATTVPAKPVQSAKAADTAGAVAKGPFPISTDPKLKDPKAATEKAPETFKAKFETTAGDFVIECYRNWGPNGVDRIYNMVKIGFFDDSALFRVVQTPRPFVVQFGIHSDPEVSKQWSSANLPKDEVKEANKRGTVTFAMAGSPDTRSTQLFINYGDNSNLDKMGFAPLCKVIDDGMSVVDKFYSGYGEGPTNKQGQIQSMGNKYLRETYPQLDYIKTARIFTGEAGASPSGSASAGAAPSASAAPSAKATTAPTAKATAAPTTSAK
jgi:peptidyl-prolyl cis-trans isomerase A (cyclophilin A)